MAPDEALKASAVNPQRGDNARAPTMNSHYEAQATFARIGKRYYWALYRKTDVNPFSKITDGFADTREAAVDQILAALNEIEPGMDAKKRRARRLDRDQLMSVREGPLRWYAHELYKRHYGDDPLEPRNSSVSDHEHLYYCPAPQQGGDVHWGKLRITKITARRVFITAPSGNRQYSLDRQSLERHGCVGGYYTEAGKERAMTIDWSERAQDIGLFGLRATYTRAEVMRAFRRHAQRYHPDKGGDPAMFHRLVEAKNRALRGAIKISRHS